MNTVLKVVQKQALLGFFWRLILAVVQIVLRCGVVAFIWRSSVHSAKFGQMHAAVTMMAADNHIPQFSEG